MSFEELKKEIRKAMPEQLKRNQSPNRKGAVIPDYPNMVVFVAFPGSDQALQLWLIWSVRAGVCKLKLKAFNSFEKHLRSRNIPLPDLVISNIRADLKSIREALSTAQNSKQVGDLQKTFNRWRNAQ